MPNNEWGDFQTPPELARQVIETLPRRNYGRVLEPTCGTGTFLRSTLLPVKSERLGIEQNENYAAQAADSAQVIVSSIFALDLASDLPWHSEEPLLVVGNPPWVTSSNLSSLRSINVPVKRNIKRLSGFDALTGSSNFDIAEYIWLKLIVELEPDRPTISLLCKTQVARNVLSYCDQFAISIHSAKIHRIDAKKWFGASVDACLFTLELGGQSSSPVCEVYSTLQDLNPVGLIGVVDGKLVSDVVAYQTTREADGVCPISWRQGIKHDASGVMELRVVDQNTLRNSFGEVVSLENSHALPMLKCTDLYNGSLEPRRKMVVPQRSLGEDTSLLESSAPKTWSYLSNHRAQLAQRKSSIYVGRSEFSIFGIGEYTFSPYKVAISGLHKIPRFRVVGPYNGDPVVFDDTCYILPFNDAASACAVHALLASSTALLLLESLVFWDAKRPITKKLLSRINLAVVASAIDPQQFAEVAEDSYSLLGEAKKPSWPEVLEQLVHAWSNQAPTLKGRHMTSQQELAL